MAAKKASAHIAGYDDLEHDIPQEDLMALVASILTGADECFDESLSADSIGLDSADEEDGFLLSDDDFAEKALAFFNDLKEIADDAGYAWDIAHGIDPDISDCGTAREWDQSPEFISAWIEEHDPEIRLVVEKFAGKISDCLYSMEDLMQEAYLAVVRAFNFYDPNKYRRLDASAYFYKAVENAMRMIYRETHAKKKTLCTQISLEDCDFEGRDADGMDAPVGQHKMSGFITAKDDVEQTVINRDGVISAIKHVKKKYQAIVELTALGYSQMEISAYLGRAQSLISYALKTFRKDIAV